MTTKDNTCKYYKNKSKIQGYCVKHFKYLFSKNIDICDDELCKKTLDKYYESRKRRCIYCGEKVYSFDYCTKHYNFLKRRKVDINDTAKCIKLLDEYYSKPKVCLYCGDKHYAKGFCNKHYSYLYRSKVDLANKEMCLEMLKKLYAKNNNTGILPMLKPRKHRKTSGNCIKCGKPTYKDKWCRHHYDYLRYRNCNLTNINECLRVLKSEKVKTIRCLYCGESATKFGFCDKHHTMLEDKGVDIAKYDRCMSVLKQLDKDVNFNYDKRNYDNKRICAYCNKEATLGMWCSGDYTYLRNHYVNRSDINACKRLLYKRDIERHKFVKNRKEDE